jgi:acetyl-CoA/propionyl-CoA carboxylase carboxyl transferase subunit
VNVLHRKALAKAADEDRERLRLDLVAEHTRVAGGVERALALGVVDRVIVPEATRYEIACALASAPGGRGHHSNIPL